MAPRGPVPAEPPLGPGARAHRTLPETPPPSWHVILSSFDVLMRRRTQTDLRDIQQAIMWSWATATIQTYRSRLSLLARRETALPDGTPVGDVVQTVLLESLAAGSPASSVRVILSAVQCTVTLGLCHFAIPAHWWRLSGAATRLAIRPPVVRARFRLETLGRAARQPLGDADATILGITILALSLGLRVGEAAAIGPADIWVPADPSGASIRLLPEKQRPTNIGYVYRTPPPFVLAWAAFLLRRADAQGRTEPFADQASLAAGFRAL